MDVSLVSVVFEAQFEVFQHLAALRARDVERSRSERSLYCISESWVVRMWLNVADRLLGIGRAEKCSRLKVESHDVWMSESTHRNNCTSFEWVSSDHLRMCEILMRVSKRKKDTYR